MIDKEQLQTLASAQGAPIVSIYLPTHERGRDIRQDPIRLKNALASVTAKLEAAGKQRSEIEALLQPAAELVDDHVYWRYMGKGLALFLGDDLFQAHKLPLGVRAIDAVGRRPHLKPLLPLLARDGVYYVLALSAETTRLYEGSRFGLDEIDTELPQGVKEVRDGSTIDRGTHAAPQARPHVSTSVGMPGSQGFGRTAEEERKVELVEHLRRVNAAVGKRLAGVQAPVIPVGLAEIVGQLHNLPREVAYTDEGVQADPAHMSPDDLHAKTWAVVKERFAAEQAAALDQFRARQGSGEGAISNDLGDVVSAAVFGRVDKLFVATGTNVWGTFDQAASKATVEDEDTADNEDLLDLAAVQTLLQGGEVHALPPEQMPAEGPLAAVLRY